MAIEFKKTAFAGHTPEIWRGEAKIMPAGFKPTQTFPVGTLLHRGTPICVDVDKLTAAVCKSASVLDGGSETKPRIPKGHYFCVGDKVSKVGATEATINSIVTTNTEYDELELSTAISGLTKNDILVESESEGKSRYIPNAVVGAELEFKSNGIPTIDAAYEAVVLYPSLNFPILKDWLNGFTLKSNPNILFIKQ